MAATTITTSQLNLEFIDFFSFYLFLWSDKDLLGFLKPNGALGY